MQSFNQLLMIKFFIFQCVREIKNKQRCSIHNVHVHLSLNMFLFFGEKNKWIVNIETDSIQWIEQRIEIMFDIVFIRIEIFIKAMEKSTIILLAFVTHIYTYLGTLCSNR